MDYRKFNYTETNNWLEEFNKTGFVQLFGIDSDEKVLEVGKQVGKIYMHPDSAENGITYITNNEKEHEQNGRGFSSKPLYPHTDRSGMLNPPKYLLTIKAEDRSIGGDSLFVDGNRLINELKLNYPLLLEKLYEAECMTTFAAKNVRYHYPVIQQDPTVLRFRHDGDMNFPGLSQYEYGMLIHYIDNCTYQYRTEIGEGSLVNNHLHLHGRTGFNGYRKMWRLLLNGH